MTGHGPMLGPKISDDFHASALVALANRVSHAYLGLVGIRTADGQAVGHDGTPSL